MRVSIRDWLLPPVVFLTLLGATTGAGAQAVEFTEDMWDLRAAELSEYMGRTVIAGSAYIKELEFQNGVIEFDVIANGRTSYPGVMFRMTTERDYERIYIRPHRASLYPDAVQYAPAFNGISGWQLYNGDGYTADLDLPLDEWVHVKLDVSGTQARMFVGDMVEPALEIRDLKHGLVSGSIGLSGSNRSNKPD